MANIEQRMCKTNKVFCFIHIITLNYLVPYLKTRKKRQLDPKINNLTYVLVFKNCLKLTITSIHSNYTTYNLSLIHI